MWKKEKGVSAAGSRSRSARQKSINFDVHTLRILHNTRVCRQLIVSSSSWSPVVAGRRPCSNRRAQRTNTCYTGLLEQWCRSSDCAQQIWIACVPRNSQHTPAHTIAARVCDNCDRFELDSNTSAFVRSAKMRRVFTGAFCRRAAQLEFGSFRVWVPLLTSTHTTGSRIYERTFECNAALHQGQNRTDLRPPNASRFGTINLPPESEGTSCSTDVLQAQASGRFILA